MQKAIPLIFVAHNLGGIIVKDVSAPEWSFSKPLEPQNYAH